jgi:hypothetical protein
MRDRAPERAELRRAQLETFATEIDKATRGAPVSSREWAALIATVGNHETHFETRLVLGNCSWEKRECDSALVKGARVFRARGAFQNHRNSLNAELWEAANDNIAAQVGMVNDGLRRAFNTCRTSGVPFPQSALRAYAGSSCTKPMKGEQERLATYARLLQVVVPREVVAAEGLKQAG